MKLAVIVVYFLRDERMPVLDLHLRSLARFTTGSFRILGTAPRVSEAVRDRLRGSKDVELITLPPIKASGSLEHSHYLNGLCDLAVEQGYDRICLMDVDAFPVRAGWNDALESRLAQGNAAVSVFRAENGDTALPHPCCCYFSSDFYRQHRPVFLPPGDLRADPAYERFLSTTGQGIDSGIGLGLVLWEQGLPWERLLRSNRHNDHYLLAGVYGDLVFHLGAMSWVDRDFRKDRQRYPVLNLLDRWAVRLRREGRFDGWRAKLWRDLNYRFSRGLVRKTNRTFQRVLDRLEADPDAYIASLMGGH